MNIDREFNPQQWIEESDSSSGDDDAGVQRFETPHLTWPCLASTDDYQITEVLDGLIICSNQISIGKIWGHTAIRKYPTVFDRKLSAFKGLESRLGEAATHIYEFGLYNSGSFTVSALVITDAVVKQNQQPKYTLMVKSYHEALRRCIQQLEPKSMSRKENLLRLDKSINIYEADLQPISSKLEDQLLLLCVDEDHVNNFPPNPRFLWCAKQLGQNQTRNFDLSRFSQFPFVDEALQLNGDYKVAVHCAIDYELDDNILWWLPNRVQDAWVDHRPKNIFRVGLVPGVGNLTYKLRPPLNKIHYVQYYTRIFAQVHRDAHQFFMVPNITKRLSEKYVCCLTGRKQPSSTAKDRLMQGGQISTFLQNIADSVSGSTTARFEAVFATSEAYLSVDTLILTAFQETNNFINTGMRSNRQMMHPMRSDSFQNRLRVWIPYFQNSLQTLIDNVHKLLDQQNLYIAPLELMIRPEEFQLCLVVETLVHFMLKGAISRRFPKFIGNALGLNTESLRMPQRLELTEWPFANLERLPDYGLKCCLEQSLQDMLLRQIVTVGNQRCIRFLKTRQEFESAVRDPTAREKVALRLAYEVVSLILCFQLSLTHPDITENIHIALVLYSSPIKNVAISYMSPTEFLARLTSKRDRGLYPQHKQLIDVICFCIQNIRFHGLSNFSIMISNEIANQISLAERPLRFSYGPHAEYLVIIDQVTMPTAKVREIWKQAIKLSNIGHRSMAPLTLNQMLNVYLDWVSIPTNRVRLSVVASAIQSLIDSGTIHINIKIPSRLRNMLLGSPQDRGLAPPLRIVQAPSESSISLSEIPLQDRLNSKLQNRNSLLSENEGSVNSVISRPRNSSHVSNESVSLNREEGLTLHTLVELGLSDDPSPASSVRSEELRQRFNLLQQVTLPVSKSNAMERHNFVAELSLSEDPSPNGSEFNYSEPDENNIFDQLEVTDINYSAGSLVQDHNFSGNIILRKLHSSADCSPTSSITSTRSSRGSEFRKRRKPILRNIIHENLEYDQNVGPKPVSPLPKLISKNTAITVTSEDLNLGLMRESVQSLLRQTRYHRRSESRSASQSPIPTEMLLQYGNERGRGSEIEVLPISPNRMITNPSSVDRDPSPAIEDRHRLQ